MRTLLCAACAAVLAGLALAAPAAAAPPKPVERRFWVEFKGSQNTKWNQPLETRKRNCYQTAHHYAKGEETWKLSTRQPVKALLYGNTDVAVLHVGSWDIEDIGASSIEVGTIRKRSRFERAWTTSGDCGGGREEHVFPKQDCGTRVPPLEVTPLLDSTGRFRFTVGTESTDPNNHFRNCGVIYPKEISEVFKAEEVRASFKAFHRSRKPVRITYGKSFKYKQPPGTRPTTSNTRVEWSFTFKPAK